MCSNCLILPGSRTMASKSNLTFPEDQVNCLRIYTTTIWILFQLLGIDSLPKQLSVDHDDDDDDDYDYHDDHDNDHGDHDDDHCDILHDHVTKIMIITLLYKKFTVLKMNSYQMKNRCDAAWNRWHYPHPVSWTSTSSTLL